MLIEKTYFYSNEVDRTGQYFVDENSEIFNLEISIEEKYKIECIQNVLLNQHLSACNNYYSQKTNGLKETEERYLMQYEDLRLHLIKLKSTNTQLKDKYQSLKRKQKGIISLQKLSETNEEKIQSYSLTLQRLSNYMQNNQAKQSVNYNEKINRLLREILNLENAAIKFADEAQQDPRKTMPYVRSATPNR